MMNNSNNKSFLQQLRKEHQAKKKEINWSDNGLLKLAPKKTGGGRVVTKERLLAIFPILCQYYELWLAYPDKLFEWFLPKETSFKLFPFQQLVIRSAFRHKQTFLVATRGFSKSFSNVLTKYLECILLPGHKSTMVAEHKTTIARIGREKINELQQLVPQLKKEVNYKKGSQTKFADDGIRLVFQHGSELDLLGIGNSTRGGRRHSILLEEMKDLPGEDVNGVVIPLVNISRRTRLGFLNHCEPHQQLNWIGSAGYKNTYAYDKCIEATILTALDPKNNFSIGMDYRVPVYYGLLSEDFVESLRNSNTYSEADFAREFLSRWTSQMEGSFFDFKKMAGARTLKKAEWAPKFTDNSFYICSIDVARSKARTVAEIFKVHIGENEYKIKLVNIFLMEGRNFNYQAQRIKDLHTTFNFSSIVIDGNGLGVGLIDVLMMPTVGLDNTPHPPYGIQNIDEYPAYREDVKPGAAPIIHIIKTNQHSAGAIHTNCFNMIFANRVKLLVDEKVAKDNLPKNITTTQEQLRFMEPYRNTTLLIDETMNLQVKNTGNALVLERIQSSAEKDTFSALEYGLWKISLMEKEQYKVKKKRISWANAMRKN